MTKRYVITGGPGTGKTTLLEVLERSGFRCKPEVSRAVIREERMKKSRRLPWDDMRAFNDIIAGERVLQHQQCQADHVYFFDRSLLDVLAYLRKEGLPEDEKLRSYARQYRYETKVFITPPWEDIYRPDEERYESYEDVQLVDKALREVYPEYGYELHELPKVSVEDRISEILKITGLS